MNSTATTVGVLAPVLHIEGAEAIDENFQTLEVLHQAGLRGIGFSFVNYLKELPYFCDEVLPRLAKMGLRGKN